MVKITLVWKKEIISIDTESSWTVNRLKVEICLLTGVPTFEQKLQGLTSAANNGEIFLSKLNLHHNHKVLLIQQREMTSKNIVSRFDQLSEKDNQMIDSTANDVLALIPQELSIEIFMLLSVPTILLCRLVSKFWEKTIASQTLWIKQFRRKWSSLLELPNQDSRKDWRGIFAAKLACERNWKSAQFESIPREKQQNPFRDKQINCVQFFDKYASSLIYNHGESVIWEKSTISGFFQKKLIAHKSAISTLHYNSSSPLIFSGDREGNVILWDTRVEGNSLPWETKSSEFIGMLPAHGDVILGLATNEDFLFTHDKNFIKVWDLNQISLTQQISFTLPLEFEENENIDFGTMQVRKDEIIASNGKIINGWDTRTGKSSFSFVTPARINYTQIVKDHFLLASHDDCTIITRDLRYLSEKPLKSLKFNGIRPSKFVYDGYKTIVKGDSGLYAVYHGEGSTPVLYVTGISNDHVTDFDYQSTSIAVTASSLLFVYDFKKKNIYLDEFYSHI